VHLRMELQVELMLTGIDGDADGQTKKYYLVLPPGMSVTVGSNYSGDCTVKGNLDLFQSVIDGNKFSLPSNIITTHAVMTYVVEKETETKRVLHLNQKKGFANK
jgi:hypothetical protein